MEVVSLKPKLTISMDYRNSRIHLRQNIVKALGNPNFIHMLIDPEKKKLYVCGTEKRESASLPVPKTDNNKAHGLDLHGQHFIKRISEIGGWSLEGTHWIGGEYNEELKMVEFDISKECSF